MKYIKKLLIFILVTYGFLSVAPVIPANEQAAVIKAESIETSTKELTDFGIDPEKTQALTRSMLENRFSERQVLEAHRIILETRQHNLSIDPLMNKANEGMVKKASPDMIIQAMKRVQSRLAFAERQSKNLSSNRSSINSLSRNIVAGLTAGITEKEMEKISTALQQRKQNGEEIEQLSSNTISMAKDMARLGVSSDRTAGLVVQAIDKGYTAVQISELKTSFISLSNNKEANELAGIFSKAIASGKGFGVLRNHGLLRDEKSSNDGGPGMDSRDGVGGGSGGAGGAGGGGGGAGGSGGGGR